MSAKYTVTTTGITVTIRERGVRGALRFNVGGSIAASIVADLAEEVNGLEYKLAALEHLAAVARAVNEWLKTIDMGGTGHQRSLEAALAELEKK